MRAAPIRPSVHLLVCTNQREASSPLGSGCGERGERAYEALKAEVARRGVVASAWITRTGCLGICPKVGCTVVRHPGALVFTDVDAGDAAELLENT
jgi:(2Fe-2S) ferredoxin